MFNRINTKISLFCLTCLLVISIPKISWGISSRNLNRYQSASDLATAWQTDISPKQIRSKNFYIPKTNKPIYLAQSIICQRKLNYYTLLRRVYYPNWGCFDQIVDIRTGRIVRSNPAPCNRNC